MFNKIIPSESLNPITSVEAQDIYNLFKSLNVSHKDTSYLFSNQQTLNKDYPFKYIEEVSIEINTLYEVAYNEMMSDNQPINQIELENRLYSNLLDLNIFVSDYIDYVLVYEDNTTWDDFVSQFNYLKSLTDDI